MRAGPPYLAVSHRVRRAYDLLAAVYDRLIRLTHPGYPDAIADAWRRIASEVGEGTILEIGPGTGLATVGLVAGTRGRVLAIDLSDRMLARARRRIDALWLVGDATRGLPIASGRVDLVAAQYVYGHLEDTGHALAEAYRVLRPGGGICLVGRPAHGLGRLGRWLNGTRGLDRANTSRELAAAGFEEVAWDEIDPDSETMASRFARVRARRPREEGAASEYPARLS